MTSSRSERIRIYACLFKKMLRLLDAKLIDVVRQGHPGRAFEFYEKQ